MGSQYSPGQIEGMSRPEELLKARVVLIDELRPLESVLAGTPRTDPNYFQTGFEAQLRERMLAQINEKLLLHATQALQSSAADLVIHARKLNKLTYVLVALTSVLIVITLVLTIFTGILAGIRTP